MEKILTFVVPVYNTEKYIIRTLSSLISNEVNVIVVDDGSTDNSLSLIKEFTKNKPNFTIIHTENKGAMAARREGLKQVKTEYFALVDSDDIIYVDAYIKLAKRLKEARYLVGIGRSRVTLPNSHIPFYSKKWNKEELDFLMDKKDFSNTSCPFWSKIFHSSCIPYFMVDSKQIVYEDMEFVYYVLAKERFVFHTNDILYQYCMRGSIQGSTSAKGLSMLSDKGVKGLLGASTSMQNKFQRDNFYKEYYNELEAIIIKLMYQRIYSLLTNPNIKNKKEMVIYILTILSSYLPNWQENKYFKEGFKGSELNDYLFYLLTSNILKGLRINIDNKPSKDYQTLLDEYNKKLVLKK